MVHENLFSYDRIQREGFGRFLCGVDEAGRGPLAGPVVTAAAILPEELIVDDLNDSKKMTESCRCDVFEIVEKKAVCYAIIFVDSQTIDEMNILAATLYGMKKAVLSLETKPNVILIDGNSSIELPNTLTVVKGDATSASIAAASVLAKVSRDRYMTKIALEYPQYGFDKHKGYPTKEHYEAISKYGLTPYHRKSFFTRSNRYFNIEDIR